MVSITLEFVMSRFVAEGDCEDLDAVSTCIIDDAPCPDSGE